ncbi:MAG: hypothetical protein ACI8SE_002149, partial [Bacteroidia bacterium]
DAKEVGNKIKHKVEDVAHDVKEKVNDFVDRDDEEADSAESNPATDETPMSEDAETESSSEEE